MLTTVVSFVTFNISNVSVQTDAVYDAVYEEPWAKLGPAVCFNLKCVFCVQGDPQSVEKRKLSVHILQARQHPHNNF